MSARRLDSWRTWAPFSQDWPPPGCEEPGKFILLEEDFFEHIAQAPPQILRLGHTFIVPTKNTALMSAVMGGTMPKGCVPALRVERQADLDGDALRDLVKIGAAHRALVITPREKIQIGLRSNVPAVWGIGYRPLWSRCRPVLPRKPDSRASARKTGHPSTSTRRAARDAVSYAGPSPAVEVAHDSA